MTTKYSISLMLILSIIFAGCAASVSFTPNGSARTPKPENAKITILDGDERYSDKCASLGQIEVYDAGLAVNCDFDVVVNKAVQKAQEVGADAIKITEIKKPDFISTCYRLKAIALAYDGPDSATEEKILAAPDERFLLFSNANPCGDYGDSTRLSQAFSKINLIPFFAFTCYDNGRTSLVKYPLTESRIQEHIWLLLAGNLKNTIRIEKSAKDFDTYLDYFTKVAENARKGDGSPLTWGAPLTLAGLDSTAIIYIPIGIERESQRHVQARFYVLLANCRGQIFFARSFEYRPDKWSKDLKSFASDVEGRLPLVW